MVAAYRARATEKGLLDDRWAAVLTDEEGRRDADAYDRVFPHAELWLAVRTAALDAEVKARIADGVTQIVILGAGLDSRAARLASPGARFFEVDQPASQADKRARVFSLDRYPVEAATYVACDFEHDDFVERLTASGFRSDAPALFVWEGVTYYLPEAAVRATLRRVATGTDPRSVIAFDFIGKKLVEGNVRDERDRGVAEHVAAMGEPLVFGLDDPVRLVVEEGFKQARVARFDALCLNLFGTWERDRKFRHQAIAIASVATPLGW
jgi:methyltransferase (TIGR00027 family)